MTYNYAFNKVYAKYPSKVGKKAALRHFNASVKTEQDIENINKALDNYLKSKRVQEGFIQNASTWFNNWQDWLDTSEPQSDYKCALCGYLCDAKVSPQYCIDDGLCFQCYKMREQSI
jgi:rubrerythrin